MGIPVKLEAFEGPLDLLLHLIEKNKIDIYDIPIVEITEQYMEYIRQMQEENLNIMSEFMVMAATLLDIKCKMLLPKEVTEEGIVILVKPEHPRKQLSPKEVTEEGIVMLFNPLQLLNALSANAVTGYSTPSLAFTFSGTTISPEYFSPVFAVSVAVLASESIR